MTAQRVVSADSHVTEPADLWQTRLDRRHRDRAPKVVENPAGGAGHLFVAEGTDPFPVEASFAAGRSGEALRDFLADGGGYGLARPSGWDPVERLKDQDLDGVEAEVIYPTLGMPLFRMTDGGLR
jgi:hypothetical protein